MALLDVENLSIHIDTQLGTITPVDKVSFQVFPGEILGIVGESGCGKSLTSLAILGLPPHHSKITASRLSFNDLDLTKLSEKEYCNIRGAQIAMIFQDPMSSLNPCYTIGFQLMEVLKIHHASDNKEQLKIKVVELLKRVGITDPEYRLDCFPHQLSGGMCQRVMIAMAIACKPKLLIADEPTTALDVTIQAQILDLIKDCQKETGMAVILITHDLGVVSEMADRLLVMYAGEVAESGKTKNILEQPSHPYTEALLNCLPSKHENSHQEKLPIISGIVPDLLARPNGCQFNPRCPYVEKKCIEELPNLLSFKEKLVRCIKPLG